LALLRAGPALAPVVLALAAVILLAPTLWLGTLISHSSPQNLTWAAQFSDQFRAGILYPRWMAQSFDGLGGPAFYFYPPLPFWFDSVVSALTANLLSVPYRLALTSTLILFASGLAMRAWLSDEGATARAALLGALAYMAAPYHLLDYYMRGAFAEFTAYAVLPLVLLGIRRPVLLAPTYAALLLSHLPTALLASLTVLPAYVLWRTRVTPRLGLRQLALLAGAGLLGVGLAALYILPALTLQGWISADQLWTAFYRADNWLLFFPSRWPESVVMTLVSLLAGAYALLALAAIGSLRRPAFWSCVCLGCLLPISGLVPWLWSWPLLAKVQFPWRLMLVVEFSVVTTLCVMPGGMRQRRAINLAIGAIVLLLSAYYVVGQDAGARIYDRAQHDLVRQDVKEYEPHGFPIDPRSTYAELGLEPLKEVPLVACAPSARRCAATERPFGALQMEIEAEAATIVTVRRFFFPAWTTEPPLPVAATEPYRLVSFVAPAGATSVLLHRSTLGIERWGYTISALSLAVFAAALALSARNNSR
jgi:hypothetical protein